MTILSKPATILLIEDDPGDQELTRRALEESHIENRLQIVNDGEEALDYIYRRGQHQNPECSPCPDLIPLDLNLPKLNGMQVLEQLQDHPNFPSMIIIVLTTYKNEDDVFSSYNLGVKLFITKPVNFTEFIQTVRTVNH